MHFIKPLLTILMFCYFEILFLKIVFESIFVFLFSIDIDIIEEFLTDLLYRVL